MSDAADNAGARPGVGATLKRRRGSFSLRLHPDGQVVAPDLAEPLIPLLRAAGGDPSLWRRESCVASGTETGVERCRRRGAGIAGDAVAGADDAGLWSRHDAATAGAADCRPGEASLLDVKAELARRMLAPCVLCERRCGVDRLAGRAGFCGLGPGLQVAACEMLYNEGPLVGAPTFCLFLRGCSLRCASCYRPDELRALGRAETPAAEAASLLDAAADDGAESWHVLGGNPDESLPGLLAALALTSRSRPLAWNSALTLAPPALALLRGVVDVWVSDLKFGGDACAARLARVDGYSAATRRNLLALAGERHVVVRHMVSPGHLDCCTRPVRAWVAAHLPGRPLHEYPQC